MNIPHSHINIKGFHYKFVARVGALLNKVPYKITSFDSSINLQYKLLIVMQKLCKFKLKPKKIMKSIYIQISDFEFNELGLNKNTIAFSELLEIIGRKITKKTLEKSIQLANKYGLSKMTMEEINDEIKEHRNAKNNS